MIETGKKSVTRGREVASKRFDSDGNTVLEDISFALYMQSLRSKEQASLASWGPRP